MNIAERLKEIEKLQNLEVPHDVRRTLGGIMLFGDQIVVGDSSSANDFVQIDEFKIVVEWLAEQLDGKITWKKPKKEPK